MSENNLAKIAISSSADEALVKSLERVNQNFEGGRVTKTDLASWLIQRASDSLTDAVIEEIHQAHFNQVVYLEALVKKLKASGGENLGVWAGVVGSSGDSRSTEHEEEKPRREGSGRDRGRILLKKPLDVVYFKYIFKIYEARKSYQCTGADG